MHWGIIISIGPQVLKRPNYFGSAKDLVQLLKHSMRLSLRRKISPPAETSHTAAARVISSLWLIVHLSGPSLTNRSPLPLVPELDYLLKALPADCGVCEMQQVDASAPFRMGAKGQSTGTIPRCSMRKRAAWKR